MRNIGMSPNKNQYSSALLGRFTNGYLFFAIAATIAVLLLIQIILSSIVASSGENLAQLNGRINEVKNENLRLKAEIAQQGALSTLEKKAQNLGMVSPTNFVYIDRSIPVAQSLR